MTDDEMHELIKKALLGVEIDRYIYRELSAFGAHNIATVIVSMLEPHSTLQEPTVSALESHAKEAPQREDGQSAEQCIYQPCDKLYGHTGPCSDSDSPPAPLPVLATQNFGEPGATPSHTPSNLRDEIILWSMSRGLEGETHATKVDRLMPVIEKYAEDIWDAGYDRAEADRHSTGFFIKSLRSNPHRSLKE